MLWALKKLAVTADIRENTGRQNVDTRHLVHLTNGTSDYLLCFKCTFSYQYGQVMNVLYVTFWGEKKTEAELGLCSWKGVRYFE